MERVEWTGQPEWTGSSATDYRDVVTAKRKLPAKNAEDGQNSFYIYVRSNDSMFVDFIHLNGKLVFWPAIFGLLLYALTVNFAGVILLTKIKKETNLEMQIKNILRYKMLINWSYIIGYLLVTPFICIFLYTYRHLWWLMITMFGLILAGVLTDYFLFHHVSDRIKELTHVNKELMELKKKHKE